MHRVRGNYRYWLFACWLGVLIGVSSPVPGGEQLEKLKMQRRFGLGLGIGGPLATMGVVADFNILPEFSVLGGLGTGMDYASFQIEGRYFLMGEWVSPYVGLSFARWWTSSTRETNLSPSILKNVFLAGQTDFTHGFSVYFLAPAIGVQFMHPLGFAVSFELEYLFELFSLRNGTYGAINGLWYF